MNKFLKHVENYLGIVLGLVILIVGIAGLILPIIPGVLLIVMGLYLIGGRHLINHVKRIFKL